MSFSEMIDQIEDLPRYREWTCKRCGHHQRTYSLVVQGRCERCGITAKFRGFAAIGAEVEDVVDAVLAWLGEGEAFALAMERKRMIDADRVNDTEE